jgi:hypothetical protein
LGSIFFKFVFSLSGTGGGAPVGDYTRGVATAGEVCGHPRGAAAARKSASPHREPRGATSEHGPQRRMGRRAGSFGERADVEPVAAVWNEHGRGSGNE